MEILNYISIVSSILNRLSLDPEANTKSQINLRNMLVCIVCEIKTIDQVYRYKCFSSHCNVIKIHFEYISFSRFQ